MAIQVNFVENKGVQQIVADVYVNAASIDVMPLNSWGGVAGGIYKALEQDPQSKKWLADDWKKRGDKIGVGQADIVKDENGLPVKLKWPQGQGYLIHAGAPKNLAENSTKQRLQDLESAYLDIFMQIYNLKSSEVVNVAIPPLGIGIYGNSPEISAEAAYNALSKFNTLHPTAKINVGFAIYDAKSDSKDKKFQNELQKLLNMTLQKEKSKKASFDPKFMPLKNMHQHKNSDEENASTPIVDASKGSIQDLYQYLNTQNNIKDYKVKNLSLRGPEDKPTSLHMKMNNEHGAHHVFAKTMPEGISFSLGKVTPKSETNHAIENICSLAVNSALPGTVFDLSQTPDDKLVAVHQALSEAIENGKHQNMTIKVDATRLKALRAEKNEEPIPAARSGQKPGP